MRHDLYLVGLRRHLVLAPAFVALALALLAAPPAQAATPVTTATERAVAASSARAQLGRAYRRGATGPGAFDCSGLVLSAFRRAGVELGVRTSQEMWGLGRRVGRVALRPGDLVFTWDRSLGHVGVYLGRGRYVHAPGPGRRVQAAPVPAGRGFIGAVRP